MTRRSSCRGTLGVDVPSLTTDPDSPNVGTAFEVVPAHLARTFGLELVIERLGVVIIDQYKTLTAREFFVGLEDQRMTLRRRQLSNVELGSGTHRQSPHGCVSWLSGIGCE